MKNTREKPISSRNVKQQDILCDDISFAAAEAYKLLRTNLQFMLPEKPCRIIGTTSSVRGEAKSTTSVNLSYTLAQSGKRVLLIDADMRLPTVHSKLDIPGAPGLSNLLAGLNDDAETLRVSKYFDNWYILPAGDIPPNPSELLGSDNMRALLEHFSGYFDYIVIDLPPVNIVADALVISPWTDGLILAVRQNYTTDKALESCMYQMQKIEAKFLGFVMTDASVDSTTYKKYGRYGGSKYGSKYGYDYGYGYGKSAEKHREDKNAAKNGGEAQSAEESQQADPT